MMTNDPLHLPKFASIKLTTFKIIAVTHKSAPLELLGKLHLEESRQAEVLTDIKSRFAFGELMFLSTCNRVEIISRSEKEGLDHRPYELFQAINPQLSSEELADLTTSASIYEGPEALTHLFEVASSLDSLVVGEREIITQVRKAYEFCDALGLTGDLIRLAIKQTIETAKQVFTETAIARNPVSVVSLAYRRLRDLGIKNSARIVFIGAGETNVNMAKYLKKHEYANFTVFNRTLAKAEVLAKDLNGRAFELKEITGFTEGFDVLITCTASAEAIVTEDIYTGMLKGETGRKVIIDLAIPADVEKTVLAKHDIAYIDVDSLKQQASENLAKRETEMDACRKIIFEKTEEFNFLLKERRVEVAFSEIPKQIRSVKETAINEVFAREIGLLDSNSKEVLEKVMQYMEKKYNAIAMKTAKEALLAHKEA